MPDSDGIGKGSRIDGNLWGVIPGCKRGTSVGENCRPIAHDVAIPFHQARPMNHTRLPETNPTPLFELFRSNYSSELLIAAVAHLGVFSALAERAQSIEDLGVTLRLAPRAMNVLLTALRAMGTVQRRADGVLELTPISQEHLIPGGAFYVGDYGSLAAQAPGVLAIVERLRTDRPSGADDKAKGAAFIFREGLESAMEQEASARALTLALAGRAKNVAPYMASRLDLGGIRHLVDVGGGTGLYSIALLQTSPTLTATILDRPEVLKVAAEFAEAAGVQDRLTLVAGDMFAAPLPPAQAILLSNILHDWDLPQCRDLVGRCVAGLPAGGRLWIHDVFLDDDLGGPLPIALYSAALFSLTEGRAYSAAEYRAWMSEAGLRVADAVVSTAVHCGVLTGWKG